MFAFLGETLLNEVVMTVAKILVIFALMIPLGLLVGLCLIVQGIKRARVNDKVVGAIRRHERRRGRWHG